MTAGDVYTVAGTGTAGYSGDSGPATSARIDLPTGVALDPGGNLYIADQDNNRVQEVAATTHTQWGRSMTAADIYTVAGSATGSTGHSGDGGAATSALLEEPNAVALDPAGDLYIADTDNNRVQFVAAGACSSACPLGWLLRPPATSTRSPGRPAARAGAAATAAPPPRPCCPPPPAWRSTRPATSTSPTPATTGASSWRPRPARRPAPGACRRRRPAMSIPWPARPAGPKATPASAGWPPRRS